MTDTVGKGRVDESLETSWAVASAGLADGVETVDGRDVGEAFLHVLEDWVCGRVMHGPSSDASRCSLKGRYKKLLRDVHRGFDFIAEVLLEREQQRRVGAFQNPEFRGLDRTRGMARIASASWLKWRAISFIGKESASGMVGMPGSDRVVISLDGGVEGGYHGDLADDASGEPRGDGRFGLIATLSDGRPALVLDLDAVGSGAIRSTAALQLWPLLDPDGRTHPQAREILGEAIGDAWEAMLAAHRSAAAEHLDHQVRLRQQLLDHPGMTPKTQRDIERRLIESEAARLLWPLIGAVVHRLFSLPSVNAGEQRNTKYRRSLPSLLPELEQLHRGLLGDDVDGDEDEVDA